MVGASGSIYGIMAACAVLFPHARVQLLFPPVNLSVRQFALAVLGVAAAVIIFQWNNAGGEAGHLGGMFAGFILTLLILWKEKMSSPRRKAASSSHYSPEPSSRRPAQAYPSERRWMKSWKNIQVRPVQPDGGGTGNSPARFPALNYLLDIFIFFVIFLPFCHPFPSMDE